VVKVRRHAVRLPASAQHETAALCLLS
jgi:hypothetical protein